MAAFYMIAQYQYRLYFGDASESPNETFVPTVLHIKAVNHLSLEDYRCDITSDDIEGFGLIPSLDVLYDILTDGFTGKNSSAVSLSARHDPKRDVIHLVLALKFAYTSETLNLALASVKDLTDQEMLSNKMLYFNKRLTELEDDRKEIVRLKDRVATVMDTLTKLEFRDAIGHRSIAVQAPNGNGHVHVCVPLAQVLTVELPRITIANLGGSRRTQFTGYIQAPDYGLDPSYYFSVFNQLVELRIVSLSSVNWSDLEHISKCRKVNALTLNHLAQLVDIGVVASFPDLKTLTITECRKIKNLKMLEQCKSLELLKAHSTLNTGVFSEALSFRIEMVQS